MNKMILKWVHCEARQCSGEFLSQAERWNKKNKPEEKLFRLHFCTCTFKGAHFTFLLDAQVAHTFQALQTGIPVHHRIKNILSQCKGLPRCVQQFLVFRKEIWLSVLQVYPKKRPAVFCVSLNERMKICAFAPIRPAGMNSSDPIFQEVVKHSKADS